MIAQHAWTTLPCPTVTGRGVWPISDAAGEGDSGTGCQCSTDLIQSSNQCFNALLRHFQSLFPLCRQRSQANALTRSNNDNGSRSNKKGKIIFEGANGVSTFPLIHTMSGCSYLRFLC